MTNLRALRALLAACAACALLVFLPLARSQASHGNAKAGGQVFAVHCAACHGPDGNGKPAVAKLLGVAFPKLGSAPVQKLSDTEIAGVVRAGKGKMKPVPGLSPSDVANVTAYLRTFAK